MNKMFLAISIFAVCISKTAAQGTVVFSNFGIARGGQSFQSPIYNVDGTTPLDSRYDAGLYLGEYGFGGFTLVGGSVTPFSGNGLFSGPTIAIPNMAPGANVEFTVAVWLSSEGATLAEAQSHGFDWGVSRSWGTFLGGGGIAAADLSGMQSFRLISSPEPGTMALVGFGGMMLAARLLMKRN